MWIDYFLNNIMFVLFHDYYLLLIFVLFHTYSYLLIIITYYLLLKPGRHCCHDIGSHFRHNLTSIISTQNWLLIPLFTTSDYRAFCWNISGMKGNFFRSNKIFQCPWSIVRVHTVNRCCMYFACYRPIERKSQSDSF